MQNYTNFFHSIAKLKQTMRFSENTHMKNKDDSAGHSWRVAVMSFMLADELKLDINTAHAMKLALIHDLPEALNGDYDARLLHDGRVSHEQKEQEETSAMKNIVATLDQKRADELYSLWEEYENESSREAKFVKAVDKIEGLYQCVEGGTDAIDSESLLGTYGNEAARNFPEIIPFFRVLKKEIKALFSEKGFEWKEEYNI